MASFLNFLHHFISTKGPIHAVERSFEVLKRFALGGRNLDRTIDLIEQTFGPRNFPCTFFVSAGPLARHKERIRRLQSLGHEIASHGIHHTRMDLLNFESQLAILNGSHSLFAQAGFDVKGFRSPYQNYNGDTRRALSQSPFSWTSGEVILWGNGLNLDSALERLAPLYHLKNSSEYLSIPQFFDGNIDIPITVPDDEMLYERCGIRDSDSISKAWLDIFNQIHQRGELFNLVFHPERLSLLHGALAYTMDSICKPGSNVWTPTLGQLAEWWRLRSLWSWQRDDSGSIRIKAPKEATILIKNSCPTVIENTPFFNDYCIAEPSDLWPAWTIGISTRTPGELRDFLHQEGFPVEYTDKPESCSLFLDYADSKPADALKILQEIDKSDKPLLRLLRWPNGNRSAFCISADICAIDLRDFLVRARHF